MVVERSCPKCKVMQQVTVSEIAYKAWQGGQFVQDAFPNLTANEREVLMTGICPKCWDEMFKEDYRG